jgi:hypothetical protein
MKFVLVIAPLLLASCIKAPDIVMVDRHTLLEEQAAGRLPQVEAQTMQAGLSPGPAPFTSGELAKSGWQTDAGHDAIAALYNGQIDDTQAIEQLLVRRCVGEAKDATLIATPDTCTGAIDLTDVSRRLEKANRNRRQVWLYLQQQRPQASDGDVRATWREQRHLAVICGGWWQKDDDKWEAKACP